MARDLKSIVDRIVDLPTLPQVVTTIMTLIEDPNSSAKDIEGVMGNDPALVAKILKLVNSPFYGLSNKVSSIQQSIAILGFNTIKSLAISASVFDLFGDVREEFSYEEFWAHSFGCATVSSFVARREPAVSTDTAFVLGLLHGMGKVVLDQYAPVEFGDILDIAHSRGLSFAEAEMEVIETSYADLGYWLAKKWKLADEVQIAIKYQDNISECPEPERATAATLAFAKYVCRVKSFGSAADFNKPSLPREAWEALTIDKAALPKIIAEINDEIEKTRAFLDIIQ